MNCKVIFKKNERGDMEMYRQVNLNIAQEGQGLDAAILEFEKRLYKTLLQMPNNQQIVLDIQMMNNPTRQDDDSKKGS